MKRTFLVAIATLIATSVFAQYPGYPRRCQGSGDVTVCFFTEPFVVEAYSEQVVADSFYRVAPSSPRWLLPTNDQTRRALVVRPRVDGDALPSALRDGYISEFYAASEAYKADARYDELTVDQRQSAFKLEVPRDFANGGGVLLVYRTFHSKGGLCGAAN